MLPGNPPNFTKKCFKICYLATPQILPKNCFKICYLATLQILPENCFKISGNPVDGLGTGCDYFFLFLQWNQHQKNKLLSCSCQTKQNEMQL
jgi:hypothetical protein